MNGWLALSLEVRLAILFVVGAMVGGFVNWAIYSLAYFSRPISPWSAPPKELNRRTWRDRIPVVGWWFLRRESKVHGTGFWFRPMMLELSLGALFALLYIWEVDVAFPAMIPEPEARVPVMQVVGLNKQNVELSGRLHAQYLSQILLLALMTAASFIDFDEKIIPDGITVTGTLLGLILAAALPSSFLAVVYYPPAAQVPTVGAIHIAAPHRWPTFLDGAPNWMSLAIGLFCLWAWCFALVHRPWHGRRGFFFALKICCARMLRGLLSPFMLLIEIFGAAAIVGVWWMGGEHWQGLLTALLGMAIGGGIIWAVRLIGFVALQKEAMGFGDVTLLAMIGTFLGWQACLIIFFLAPMAGLILGVGQWLLKRENEIPYGPFLCLAALFVLVRWSDVWNWSRHLFDLGWRIPLVLLVGLALMAILLRLWRFIAERWLLQQDGEG